VVLDFVNMNNMEII